MIRASSVHKITTNRPFFDGKGFAKLQAEFKQKVEKKGINYIEDRGFAEDMVSTPGLKTIAEKIITGFENIHLTLIDPLHAGAQTALQELYLEKNYGFYNMSIKGNDPALKKGVLVEDDSISLLGNHLGIWLTNNKERVSNEEYFLTGEADVLYDNVVRDIKSPLNWATFRKKDGIETAYHWQLIAYCLLYEKTEAYLDYILMPMPKEMIIEQTKYMNSIESEKFVNYNFKIGNMEPKQRIKTYVIDPIKIKKDIEFLKRRLIKAKAYYETLNYNICMKMN